MSDPRVNPDYRGVKCPGCGERWPSLLGDMCAPCEFERLNAQVEKAFVAGFMAAVDAYAPEEATIKEIQALLTQAKRERL